MQLGLKQSYNIQIFSFPACSILPGSTNLNNPFHCSHRSSLITSHFCFEKRMVDYLLCCVLRVLWPACLYYFTLNEENATVIEPSIHSQDRTAASIPWNIQSTCHRWQDHPRGSGWYFLPHWVQDIRASFCWHLREILRRQRIHFFRVVHGNFQG